MFSFTIGAEKELWNNNIALRIINYKPTGFLQAYKARLEWIPHPRIADYQYTLTYIKYLDNNIIDANFYKSLYIVNNQVCDSFSKDYNGADLNNLLFNTIDNIKCKTEVIELLTNEYLKEPEKYLVCELLKYKNGRKKWVKNLKNGKVFKFK